MLRINLLPPYIYEKRKVVQTAFVFGLIFVAILAGMIAWTAKKNHEAAELEKDAVQMEQQATEVQNLQSLVSGEQAKAPPLESKVKYMEALQKYNLEVPKLYEEVARFTYKRIVYSSMQMSGNELTMQAHARTLGDCGRFLLNMYRATNLFSAVSINPTVPGWPPGTKSIDANGLDFTVTCTLVNTITAPTYSAAGSSGGDTAAAGPSAGAMGGMGAAPGGAAGYPGRAAGGAAAGGSPSDMNRGRPADQN